jgi:hypothetical protein
LSTLGLRTSDKDSGFSLTGETGSSEGPAGNPAAGKSESLPAWLGWLDLVVLAAALPVFLAADLPLAGYAVAGGAWIAQRVLQVVLARRATASKDPRTIVGFTAASMILRGWMMALAIFLVGLGNNEAGLAAAVLVISLFTIYFALQLALRPFDRRGLS